MTLETQSHPLGGLSGEQREVYLVEYEKAQDSAEHHDMLVWSISSLNWVGSALLMGFVLGNLQIASQYQQKVALLAISTVGVMLAILVWRWVYQLRCVKVAKYKRCQELEVMFGMQQHSKLQYKAGSQTRSYAALMIVFILAWGVLVALVIAA